MSKFTVIIKREIKEYLKEQQSVGNNLNNNFWNWFGSSKVKEGSEPLACYHGSPNLGINYFDISKISQNKGNLGHYGYGFYFSYDIKEAKTYGSTIYKCYLKIENPFTGTEKQLIELKNNGMDTVDDLIVKSIDFESFKNSFKSKDRYSFDFINNVEKYGIEKAWSLVVRDSDTDKLNIISDIIEYTTLNKNVRDVPDHIIDDLNELGVKPKLNQGFSWDQSLHWITDLGNRSQDFTNIIIDLGYDGVIYGSELVLFEPNQIKSVDNDGSWDFNDDNIFS